jgi:hypothetical protein
LNGEITNWLFNGELIQETRSKDLIGSILSVKKKLWFSSETGIWTIDADTN